MHVIAWPFGQPFLYLRVFVCSIVIQYEMDIEFGLDRPLNPIEKPEKLLMPVACLALTDHRSFKNVESGKQRGRSMTLIIVCLALWQTRSQRKYRLGAIQRLNLTLFIHAQHDGIVRWIHIEPDDVAHFRSKITIVAELERFDPMRLQLVPLPNSHHGGWADFCLAAIARTLQ